MTINYADYPPEWKPLANDAADSSFRGSPMSMFYEGGRVGTKPVRIRVPKPSNYAKGGLATEAKQVRDAGVGGDDLIVHINRQEFDELKKHWGDPTINPHTGMPQFTPFYKQSWFAPVAALVGTALMATGVGAPIGAALLGSEAAGVGLGAATGIGALGETTVGTLLGNTLIGGAAGALGSQNVKGALTGAALAGLGTAGSSVLGGLTKGTTAGSWLGGDAGSNAVNVGSATSSGAYDASLGGTAASQGAAQDLINTSKLGADSVAGATTGLGSLMKPSFLIPAAVLGAAALGNTAPAAAQSGQATSTSTDPNMTRSLNAAPLARLRLPMPTDYYNYGAGPEHVFYGETSSVPPTGTTSPVAAAHGGALSHYVQGGGTGRSDSIDAKLSDGEYVMDAETVALLGDGSSKAGAQRLDQFRANIRKQKGKQLMKGKFSPDAKSPEEYI